MATFCPSTVPLACRPAAPRRARAGVVRASADKPSFFNLKDMESTTGSWDVYGVQETKRYAEIQNTFFERASANVSRRESMYSFLFATSTLSLMLWGGLGATGKLDADLKLPIAVGPKAPPTVGPRGRI